MIFIFIFGLLKGMRNLITLALLFLIFSACSKVSQKRLEGTWRVKEIKEIPNDALNTWQNLLDTLEVRVVFYQDGIIKTFYFYNDLLTDVSIGNYLLAEEDEKLTIDLSDLIFNAQGFPFDVTSLRRNSMTLQGRFYLNTVIPTVPADSFATLQWDFEK